MRYHYKKGDTVLVLKGQHAGKQGEIDAINPHGVLFVRVDGNDGLITPMKQANVCHEPRKVGGVYRDWYWQENYTVQAIEKIGITYWFTVRWTDGHVTRHCTAWNSGRDRVISSPLLTQ